jgi:hypothetical protein
MDWLKVCVQDEHRIVHGGTILIITGLIVLLKGIVGLPNFGHMRDLPSKQMENHSFFLTR